MMDESAIISDIRHFVEADILSGGVKLDAGTLLQNAGIDSFSLVEILLFLQEKYGLQIPDDQLVPDNFKTLTSLARMVLRLSANAS
jgi:acyl carrier protein